MSSKDTLSDKFKTIPKTMIVTYYWIEVGMVELIQTKDEIKLILDIYELSYLDDSIQR